MYSGQLRPHESDAPINLTRVQRLFNRLPQLVGLLVAVVLTCGAALQGIYWVCAVTLYLLLFVLFGRQMMGGLQDSGAWPGFTDALLFWISANALLLLTVPYGEDGGQLRDYLALVWSAGFPLMLFGLPDTRAFLFKFLGAAPSKRSVVIAGVNLLSQHLADHIVVDPQLGLTFKGFFDDRSPARLGTGGGIVGRLSDLAAYVKQKRIDLIYIALPMVQEGRILKLLDDLRDTTASIYFVPDIFVFDLIQARIAKVKGLPVLAVCETPFYGVRGMVKRVTDVVLAGSILALVSPLLLAIALGVKLSSPGPVLFKQRRYGLGGEEIVVYKFRSMTVCEDGEHIAQATRRDPRVTRFGAFIRRTSLDELPQFINVLQGHMSIVGPRPHAVVHNETYRKLIKGYMMRHKVKPGITGWAQVNGFRGETESLEKMRARIEYDLDYLRHWSLGLDLKIILRTFLLVLKDRSAY
jgi:putative colanic acid biosynthesis UDP-glucose lipid carrier transferase